MPVSRMKVWNVPFCFLRGSMYAGQLLTMSLLLDSETSLAMHLAGSCTPLGVSKNGNFKAARLPAAKAAPPAPRSNVRRDSLPMPNPFPSGRAGFLNLTNRWPRTVWAGSSHVTPVTARIPQ
jgi:hypothetical protein